MVGGGVVTSTVVYSVRGGKVSNPNSKRLNFNSMSGILQLNLKGLMIGENASVKIVIYE